MKKIFLFFLVFCSTISCSYASSDVLMSNESIKTAQKRIETIGVNLLNSSGIEYRTVFDFNTSKTKNAFSRYSDRQIVLYRGLYNRLNSDDEVAAVLAHEISHSVDSYNGILRGYFSCLHILVPFNYATRKYEYKADKRAVDYMVNANYNPVALIAVMSKTFPQSRYDWYSSHPLASKRMMEVYEYIYKKYPEFLVNNSYKNDPFYQNFLLTSKKNRAKLQKKIETKSKGSVHYL